MTWRSWQRGRRLPSCARALDEPELSVGIVLSIQTHGSLLNWQPHIHALVTDGGFRPDGTFVRLPAHSADVLTEAFRRGFLKLFALKDLADPETAAGMLEWQHSGFSVHDGVWLDQDNAAAHERLARYCARCPVSLERLEYDAETGTVTYTSEKAEGPTAGRHSFERAGGEGMTPARRALDAGRLGVLCWGAWD